MTEAVVITCSTRAASGVYPDGSGQLLANALREWGFRVAEPVVVADGAPVGEALRAALAEKVDLVVTTGGTGLNPTDRTPEETAPLLDLVIPGIPQALRAPGVAKGIPGAMLSRGLAGVAGSTLVINLPGSSGGVKDALTVLQPVIAHALDQIRGGDHPR